MDAKTVRFLYFWVCAPPILKQWQQQLSNSNGREYESVELCKLPKIHCSFFLLLLLLFSFFRFALLHFVENFNWIIILCNLICMGKWEGGERVLVSGLNLTFLWKWKCVSLFYWDSLSLCVWLKMKAKESSCDSNSITLVTLI